MLKTKFSENGSFNKKLHKLMENGTTSSKDTCFYYEFLKKKKPWKLSIFHRLVTSQ